MGAAAAIIDTHLKAGEFYGEVSHRQRRQGLVLSTLRHDAPRKIPAHSHELAFFCLLLDGDYREQCDRRIIEYQPFTLVFHPPGLHHRDEIGPRGGRFFSVEAENRWMEALHDYTRPLDPSPDVHGGEVLWLAMRLYQEHLLGAAGSSLTIESLTGEMLAGALRARVPEEKHAPAWLRRVVDYLYAEFDQKITLDALSKEAGVHPVHLSRVFRKFYRQPLGEWVHRLRVLAACRQLRDPEASLADVGAASGFADQSHFTRVFKAITGTTPGAFRAAIRV
jgi:AraC family transcriptional regulator